MAAAPAPRIRTSRRDRPFEFDLEFKPLPPLPLFLNDISTPHGVRGAAARHLRAADEVQRRHISVGSPVLQHRSSGCRDSRYDAYSRKNGSAVLEATPA